MSRESRAAENDPDAFYPIPSEPKAPGWNRFLELLPRLLQQRTPTRGVMPLLHRATTHGVELEDLPDELNQVAARSLLTQHRDQRVVDYVQNTIRLGIFSADNAEQGRILPDTRCHVNITRIGKLRQYGVRSVDGGPSEKIYASHCKPFHYEHGTLSYYGLSEGLNDVFTELCERFDALEKQYEHGTLDEKLRVITYFQSWGASIIHPFCDANGRAFGAKLVLDLNRIGMNVTSIPTLGEINPYLANNALALMGERFLESFLQANKLPLFTDDQRHDVELHAEFHRDYMTRLKAAILAGIRQGIYPEPTYETFIGGAVFPLVLALSRDGHIPRDFYDTKAPEIIAAHQETIREGNR